MLGVMIVERCGWAGGGFESVSTRMSPCECMGSVIIVMRKIRSELYNVLILSLFRSDWTEMCSSLR